MTINTLSKRVSAIRDRSAWGRGVAVYAAELLDGLKEAVDGGYFDAADLSAPRLLSRALLNGARDWDEYSYGGCSLYDDGDIAERLCTPSELKRTRNGARRPNAREDWLDVQSRALYQAAERILRAAAQISREENAVTVVTAVLPIAPAAA